MFRLLVVTLCVAVAFAKPISEYDEDWMAFKKYHNKEYKVEEELMRRQIWEGHLKLIAKHNREYDMGLHTYTMGVNEYTDWTNEEFVGHMNGYVMRNVSTGNPMYIAPSNINDPDEVDWRKEGYVTPVKNQKQCGSCWAFSTTGSLEGQHFKKTKTLVSLSEQNLVDCSKKEGNKGCKGGLMDNGFEYIKVNGGIDTEESYPYTARDGRCHFNKANVGATCTGYTDLKEGSEEDLKSALTTVGPISVAMDASHMSFQMYRSGVYSERRCSSRKLDHGVLAVGYGTYEGKDYWLVKNSWGTTWGMEGYFMIARNANNMCGLATQASYPLV